MKKDTRVRISTSFRTLVVVATALCGVAAAAPAAAEEGAEADQFQQACAVLGGQYEERREGCDPECVITYFCEFEDGSGRECDAEGACGPLGGAGSAAGGATAASAGDCAQAERAGCQEQCDGKSGRELASCVSSCVSEACGDDSASGGATVASEEGTAEAEGAQASCDDCKSQCKQKCGNARGPMKKRCESACEQKCESACQ